MPTLQLASIKDLSIPKLDNNELDAITSALQKEVAIQREIQALQQQQAEIAAGFWQLPNQVEDRQRQARAD